MIKTFVLRRKVMKKNRIVMFALCLMLLTACTDRKSSSADGPKASESSHETQRRQDLPDVDNNEPWGDVPEDTTPVPTQKYPEVVTPAVTEEPVPTEKPEDTPTPTPEPEITPEPTEEPEDPIDPMSDPGYSRTPGVDSPNMYCIPDEEGMAAEKAKEGCVSCIVETDGEGERDELVLATANPVKEVNIIRLDNYSYDEDGNLSFEKTVVFSLETMDSDHPIALEIPELEDIPKVGVSYIEADGERVDFAIARGGADGYVFLAQIN